jgi:phosphate:Na+ symporter
MGHRLGILILVLFTGMAAAGAGDFRIAKATDALGNDDSGDRQVAVIGQSIQRPLVVQVTTARGKPAAGVRVVFLAVDSATTFIDRAEAFTDIKGFARCVVKPASGPGTLYVQARLAADPANPIVFAVQAFPPHWWMLALLGTVGGIAFFLFGLRFSSRGLQKAAGAKLRQMLWSLTGNRFMGMGVGVLVTAIIQSSTATTVMLVSLANAGLIGLRQVLGVVLGADIGTTITVQLIAFKLADYCLIFVAGGFLAMVAAGKRSWRYYPQIVFGFGLIFYGMKLTADALEPMKALPWFLALFSGMADQPLLGIVIGILFTLLIRSSAATIGILLTLAFQGLVDLRAAMPVIIGANVGTCGSALLAAWGGTSEAVLVAWGHTVFKLIAGIAAWLLIAPFTQLVAGWGGPAARQIANAHTAFNLSAALLFLPFLTPLEKLIRALAPAVPVGQKAFGPKYLDDRMLDTPSLAIGSVFREISRMADLVRDMLVRSLEVLEKNDSQLAKQLIIDDDKIDTLEEAITPFVAKLTQEDLSGDQPNRGVELLYIVNDLEHIGDVISKNIMGHANKKIEQQLAFSENGLQEIRGLHRETLKTLEIAIAAFASGDRALAGQALARKDEVHTMERALYKTHLERLSQGYKESQETSTIHLDVLSDLERINFHASQIGAAVLSLPK